MITKIVRAAASLSRTVSLILVLAALPATPGQAQENPAPMDAETARALLQRVKDLEAQVGALRAQVQSLAEKADASPAQAPTTPAPTAAASSAAPAPAPSATDFSVATNNRAEATVAPRLRLRGYGDVGWSASNEKGTTNSFALGQFNLFITSRLTDRASFLSESIVEADSANNEFGIDLERLELIYALSDRLNLQFGRYHTEIGYYNTAFHHSALMQTALGRPFLFQFEDVGGILPVHSVGMSADGLISTRLGLHFVADIGNGRSPRVDMDPVQNVRDDNNGKSFNLGFFVRPDWLRGLQFGFSNYHDHITPPGKAGVTENILFAHVVYQNSRFEFLNEGVLLRHAPENTDFISNIPGFYSQVSRRFGNYRPYFRYEYVNAPVSDPLISDVGLLHGPKAGVRYDLNEYAAFKIEFGRDIRRTQTPVNHVGTQLSFAF